MYWNSTSNHNIWIGRRPWYLHCGLVTHNSAASLSTQPSIDCDAAATGDIHLVYSDLRDVQTDDWTATYRHGWARGDSWSEPVTLSKDHVGFTPCIKASASGRLFSAWTELEGDEWFIAGSASDDSGRTWSDPVRITNNCEFAAEPRIAASGDTCLVAWQSSDAGNWEIYFGSHAFPPDLFLVHRSSFIVPRSLSLVHRSSFLVHRSSFLVHRWPQRPLSDSAAFMVHRCLSTTPPAVLSRRLSFMVHRSGFPPRLRPACTC
jgi:hypothetical protein